MKSNPYCVVELSGKRWQTPVVKNTNAPQWDFEINTVEYELGDRIIFSVYYHELGVSDDFVGKHELSCAEWGHLDVAGKPPARTNPKCSTVAEQMFPQRVAGIADA